MTLTLQEVRDYIKVPATALSDADLSRMLASASDDQAQRCQWTDPRPDTLDQALLRRVQREVAARNLPLGMIGLDATEYGPESLARYDALVDEHERAYRIPVLG